MKHNPLKRSALLAIVVGAACLALALAGALAPLAAFAGVAMMVWGLASSA